MDDRSCYARVCEQVARLAQGCTIWHSYVAILAHIGEDISLSSGTLVDLNHAGRARTNPPLTRDDFHGYAVALDEDRRKRGRVREEPGRGDKVCDVGCQASGKGLHQRLVARGIGRQGNPRQARVNLDPAEDSGKGETGAKPIRVRPPGSRPSEPPVGLEFVRKSGAWTPRPCQRVS